jgi:DNA-binding response OmpR family regulator
MRIGVLHTDPAQSDHLAKALEGQGYRPKVFADGQALEAAVQSGGFDVLLMRWDGPTLSGVALMHRMRARLAPAPAAILLVDDAAPGAIAEGADAILRDPCPAAVLLETVAQVAARRGLDGGQDSASRIAGQLEFDDGTGVVRVHGMPVQLTAKEYALAKLLIRNVGTPLSRSQIMVSVWGRDDNPGSRTLDAHVAQVRKRLLLRPDQGWRLSSVYGFGYRLDRTNVAAIDRAA